jgi:hypothetical protein
MAAAVVAIPARAEFGDLLFQLTASDARNGDGLGWSVDISANTVIAGNRQRNPCCAIPTADAAYIFNAITGEELRKINAPPDALQDHFASAVAIDHNTILAGAPGPDDFGSGSAYLFNVSTGQQLSKVISSDIATGDIFGQSVAIDGNVALVGSQWDDDFGNKSGSAYLFNASTGQQLRKLNATDASEDDWFGFSVAISGNVALVGALAPLVSDNQPGAAYLFDARTGQQLLKLTPSDSAPHDKFGKSVAISGNTAIVGGTGAAYLFDVTTGHELFKLTASDASETFGQTVAISGTTGIVGDPGNAGNAGAAYVFNITTGQQLIKLEGSGTPLEGFGFDVAIDSNLAVAGAFQYFNPDLGTPPGSVYVFDVTRDVEIAGDFDRNGTIDAADYVVWRNGLGTTYTQADYSLWRANFGRSAANTSGATADPANSATPAIPEPTALLMTTLAVAPLLPMRGRR